MVTKEDVKKDTGLCVYKKDYQGWIDFSCDS